MLVDLQGDVSLCLEVGCMRSARTYPYWFCILRGSQIMLLRTCL